MLAAGWRRGIGFTVGAVAVAALTVLPWTIRNYVVSDGALIPISVQDGAAYGTFNDEAANDPRLPYAWRFALRDPPAVLAGPPVDDGELRSGLQDAALDYIGEHPLSVLEAFYWNGLSRFWDVRRPALCGRRGGRPRGARRPWRSPGSRSTTCCWSRRWSGSGACGDGGRW